MKARTKLSNTCIDNLIQEKKKIVKVRDKKIRDLSQIRYIEDESNKILIKDEEKNE